MKNTIDKTTIGGRIKAARKAKGMTQEMIAEKMCITASLICCYEKNKVDLPLSVIGELAKYLEVSATYLVDGVENELDEECLEILKAFMAIKNEALRKIAIIQIQALCI